jgi:hypothetical protein
MDGIGIVVSSLTSCRFPEPQRRLQVPVLRRRVAAAIAAAGSPNTALPPADPPPVPAELRVSADRATTTGSGCIIPERRSNLFYIRHRFNGITVQTMLQCHRYSPDVHSIGTDCGIRVVVTGAGVIP